MHTYGTFMMANKVFIIILIQTKYIQPQIFLMLSVLSKKITQECFDIQWKLTEIKKKSCVINNN